MNMMPCCDGDNCNTNWLMEGSADSKERSVKAQSNSAPLLKGKNDPF
jgi:hypothetical protein